MSMKVPSLDDAENLAYRIGAEGFDYCFRHYSDWKEIEDQKFQCLRKEYENAAQKLEDRVKSLCIEAGVDPEDHF